MNAKLLVLIAAMAMVAGVTHADTYPSRPLEWIVPTPPGGGVDSSARIVAQQVEKEIGQPVAIVNIAGGSGAVGITQFLKGKQDGYTLLAIANGQLTTVPNTMPVSYGPSDFRPIIATSSTAYVLCVRADFPADTAEEFIHVVKANPDKYTYGTDGIGNIMHLAGERLFGAYGAKAIPVPFGGAGETLKNFLGGHIDIYGGSVPPIRQYVENGEAKCLLTMSKNRNPALPEAESMTDIGHPTITAPLWRIFLGPKGMSDEQAKVIADAIEKSVSTADYDVFMEKRGEWLEISRGDDLAQRMQEEYDAFAEVALKLGLKN